jgi:hypothetical protein
MEIEFPDRPEQAIVAAVIQEAGKIADQKNRYLGRTAVQKILYFLQVCGVPLRYRFDVYHYGPFCSGVFNDIDWLTIMEIVDNLIIVVIPGAMDAGLSSLLFWGSLAFALAVAFVAAFPVNRYMISRGKGHAVVRLLPDRLVEQDHAGEVLLDARRGEKQPSIGSTVFFAAIHADGLEAGLAGSGRLVGGEEAFALRDHRGRGLR